MSAFTCEPFSNLVQRHILNDHGVTFTAERAEDGEHDFLLLGTAGADQSCREQLLTALCGLWICTVI